MTYESNCFAYGGVLNIASGHARASLPQAARVLGTLLLCTACVLARPVRAQTDSESGGDSLAEVVVTSTKRAESIQQVPIAITAFQADQLEKRQIVSAADLAGSVSNLSINLPNGDQQPVYSIRGINTADFSIGQNGPVAVYYDEVYRGTTAVQGVSLYDLERVEVLKGPQGTLYGKNTTGGAINFITRVPDFTTAADLTAGYGNYNHFHAEGGAQTALSDTVAVRLAFTSDRADGWETNTAPRQPNLNSTDNFGIRGTLVIKPSSRLNITLRASTSQSSPLDAAGAWVQLTSQGVGYPSYPAPGINGTVLQPEAVPDPRIVYTAAPHHNDTKTTSAAATVKYKLTDDLDLTSITSWDHGSQSLFFDGYTHLDLLRNNFHGSATQFAQDLRLTSQRSGPFNFITGLYYSREFVRAGSLSSFLFDIDVNQDNVINAADCVAGGFFATCSQGNSFEQLKRSAAFYSDASYVLTEQLKLRGGLRYTHDRGDLSNYSAFFGDVDGNPIVNTIPGAAGQTASLQFVNNNVSGRAGLDFQITHDILLYGSYSRGYRGGAFNNQAFNGPQELNVAPPETVSSYEVGFKTETFAHRVRLNGAVFYMDYKNQQVESFNPQTSANTLVSLGASKVKGGELELDVQAAEGLRLFTSLGVLSTRIESGVANGNDESGHHLINAPNITASAGFDYDRSIAQRLRYNLHVDGAYTGKQYFDLDNLPQTTQGGYLLLNGRLRFGNADDRVGVSLWAKNLLNRSFYANMSYTGFLSANYVAFNAPRTYGVWVDAKF